ncbi:hypothetical protein [Nostoc sp. CCY0012]|uniref:hypothetical protein n=1 Tax=Nostoc sp. CCY0012 TaxID=1056123 RepID=UPI0039C613BE
MKLLAATLFFMLPCLVIQPAVAKPINCTKETPSKPESNTNRTINLPKLGFSITVPSDTRAILLNDGSVGLVTNADYEFLYCLYNKYPVGGRGMDMTVIDRADRRDPYSRFSHIVTLRPGFHLTYKISDINTVFVTLRVETSKGVFDIENTSEGSRDTTPESLKLEEENLTRLAQLIDIH